VADLTITKHQVETALGNIRVLGPDIPDFRRDVKLVWDYIAQVEDANGAAINRIHRATDVLEGKP